MAFEDSALRERAPAGKRLSGEKTDAPVFCPASRAIELVAHKWTIHILFALHQAGGPIRFRKLQVAVKPITQKELTKRLRDLERAGMVDRQIFAEVPPRVEYRLTELGSSLIPALTGLHEWAERYGVVVDRNQRRAALGQTESGADVIAAARALPAPRRRVYDTRGNAWQGAAFGLYGVASSATSGNRV